MNVSHAYKNKIHAIGIIKQTESSGLNPSGP